MHSLDLPLDWLNYTFLLLQRLCVVVTVAFASIRVEWLRRALLGATVPGKDPCRGGGKVPEAIRAIAHRTDQGSNDAVPSFTAPAY